MKKVIYYLLGLLCFSSCETVVDLELNEGDKTLVVESYLEFSDTADVGSARVYLTESSNFNGNTSPNIISNATILINDTYVLDEDPDSLGFYVSNLPIPYLGQEKFDIDIVADIDGKEGNWTASNDFTNVPNIDSIYYVFKEAAPPFQDEGYYVKIMFEDPVDEQNFYHLTVLINDTLSFELTPGTKRSLILRDEYVNGSGLNFEVNDEPLKEGQTLKVILSSITEDTYYYYFNMYTLLTETSGIGAPPPFPLYGNLVSLNNNFPNALGNFQVRSTTVKEITVE
tara:strand:- start:217 stop:1068 length:852 start_codon:yes stop_codon:yes gene_type:complete